MPYCASDSLYLAAKPKGANCMSIKVKGAIEHKGFKPGTLIDS
jgi:hypothetical protein